MGAAAGSIGGSFLCVASLSVSLSRPCSPSRAPSPLPAVAAACSGADSSPSSLGEAGTARATLCLLNQERASRGLRKLRSDARLRRAADRHAGDMVARRYFAHESKSGASFVTRIKRTGWTRSRRSWTGRREHRLRLRLAGDARARWSAAG